jgi:small conductance mechanosensitive channel
VSALLREIDEVIRTDDLFGDSILEPLEIQGVDKLIDGGAVVRARIKTRPGKQWPVGREFNRRIMAALVAENIPSAVPQYAVQMVGAADPSAGREPARPLPAPAEPAPLAGKS